MVNRPGVFIVGAGQMGCEIAACHMLHGYEVFVTDKDKKVLSAVFERIHQLAGRPVEHVHLCEENTPPSWVSLVLECITEEARTKQALAALPKNGAIWTSNTSAIPADMISFTNPKFCVFHFCHPVLLRNMIEVIPSKATSQETVMTLCDHAMKVGKTPVIEKGGISLLNRILFAYFQGAGELLQAGLTIGQIESISKIVGMGIGPFTFADEIGLATLWRAGYYLQQCFPMNRSNPLTQIIIKLAAGGQTGRRVGRGFYVYGKRKVVNPKILEILPQVEIQRPIRFNAPDFLFKRVRQEVMKILGEHLIPLVDMKIILRDGLDFPLSLIGKN